MSGAGPGSRRVAFLAIVRPGIALWRHDEPALARQPLLLVAREGASARVLAVDPEAARAGVRVGQTLAQARAIVPEVVVRPVRPRRVEEVLEALVVELAALTPHVVRVGPRGQEARHAVDDGHGFVLGIQGSDSGPTGVMHVWSSPRALLEAAVAMARALGLVARAGMARRRFAARMAALWGEGEVTVLDGRREEGFVKALPLSAVGPVALPVRSRRALHEGIETGGRDGTVPIGTALGELGLSTLGDLHLLGRRAVADRYGPGGVALWELADGVADEELPTVDRRRPVVCGCVFDEPVRERAVLVTRIEGLIGEVAGRMARDGEVCDGVEVALERADGRGVERSVVRVPGGSSDGGLWVELVRRRLEEMLGGRRTAGVADRRSPVAEEADPGEVAGVTLRLWGRAGGEGTAGLFDRRREAPVAPAVVAARLVDRLGAVPPPGGVFVAQVRPDQAWCRRESAVFGLAGDPRGEGGFATPRDDAHSYVYARLPRGEGRWALRRWERPVPLGVVVDGGRPICLVPRGRASGTPGGPVRVLEARGPYRASGAWWQAPPGGEWDGTGGDAPYDRRHFLLGTADGAWRWVYEEGGEWFLEGELD